MLTNLRPTTVPLIIDIYVNKSEANKCFNYNFKGVCHRFNCIYKHNCMKCSLVHPAITCLRFHRINGYQTLDNRPRTILPAIISLSIFNRAPSGFESTDFKFFESKGCLGPL
jgi:hypothetical protein